MTRTIIYILALTILIGCNSKKHSTQIIQDNSGWTELDCGLWKDSDDEIGFQSKEAIDDMGNFGIVYLTNIGGNDSLSLKDIVDIKTFQHLEGSFYKDKNHIYTHSTNSCGGYLYILKADHESFKPIGGCYGKDKYHIYFFRGGIMQDVDYETFESHKDLGCYARDKNGYYFWEELMNENEPGVNEQIEEIDKIINSH